MISSSHITYQYQGTRYSIPWYSTINSTCRYVPFLSSFSQTFSREQKTSCLARPALPIRNTAAVSCNIGRAGGDRTGAPPTQHEKKIAAVLPVGHDASISCASHVHLMCI